MNCAKRELKAGAFTLVELLVAMGAGLLVLGAVYMVMNSARILVAKTFAINLTASQAQLTMDRLQLLLQQAYTQPLPINSQGTVLSNSISLSGSTAMASGYLPVFSGTSYLTVTGTGAGVVFDRVLGGPYNLIVPSGGISATASSIQIVIDSAAQIPPPVPKAGDVISIYTTAILNGVGNVVRAKVSGAALGGTRPAGAAVTAQVYTVNLASSLTNESGTTGIAQKQDSRGNAITPSATLLRPTALVITTGSIPELRLIEGYAMNGSNVNIDQNYVTLTRDIQPVVSVTGTDSTPSGFGVVRMQSATASGDFVSMVLHVRSQTFDRVLANKQRRDFSTYMGVGLMVPLKCKPD